ncbi:hypothetical protein G5I_11026 [Acromyrmex echinatior]|uniref:Uncharacterized protein n=1 Tax=Acromyrmex echinatior TaxID=103372 RepID=F4WYH5_ACREC|nr:hypothetical protein G5I_11026 [Acromyrmex echinatior]
MRSSPTSKGLSSLTQKVGLTFALSSGTGVIASVWTLTYIPGLKRCFRSAEVHIADIVADKEAHRRRRKQQQAHRRYCDLSQGSTAEAGTGGKFSPSEAPQRHIQRQALSVPPTWEPHESAQEPAFRTPPPSPPL